MIITYNNLFFSGSILTKQYFKVHVMVGVSFEFLNYCFTFHFGFCIFLFVAQQNLRPVQLENWLVSWEKGLAP